MESSLLKRNAQREKRKLRVRKFVRGVAEKPRLSVFRSNRHICAQLIDDELHKTLASAGTIQKEFQGALGKKSKESAREVGKKIAELARSKDIQTVVFDRGRYKYHGIIAELANAAREAGLKF